MPTTRSLTPVWVSAGVTFSRVSAAQGHTCARADDGGLWCWGANDAGQLGPGAGLMELRPHRVVF
jgi:alpha-tubulin suppressor-like RCC1 family protein